jgi:hypothetical protein
VAQNVVTVFDGTGKRTGVDIRDTSSGGMVVSASDLDMDGYADLVTAPVKRGNNRTVIKIFNTGDSSQNKAFIAYKNTVLGANIAVGELGWGIESSGSSQSMMVTPYTVPSVDGAIGESERGIE